MAYQPFFNSIPGLPLRQAENSQPSALIPNWLTTSRYCKSWQMLVSVASVWCRWPSMCITRTARSSRRPISKKYAVMFSNTCWRIPNHNSRLLRVQVVVASIGLTPWIMPMPCNWCYSLAQTVRQKRPLSRQKKTYRSVCLTDSYSRNSCPAVLCQENNLALSFPYLTCWL